MPSSVSPLADLLNTWAGQMDDARRVNSLATKIAQNSPGADPQQAAQPAQQGGILSNLLGFGGGQQAAQPLQQAPQTGGVLGQLFGMFGGGAQQPGAPLNLQPAMAPAPASPVVSFGSGGTRPVPAPQMGGNAPQLAQQNGTAPSAPQPPMAFAPPTPVTSAPAPTPAPQQPANVPMPGAPLPTFAAAGGAPGQDNTSRALAFYQSKGLSPLAASALVGGFHAESGAGLNTNALNRGDGTDGSNSVGIAQWNGARAAGLRSFAAANGLDPSDINTQLQYSWQELNGPEKGTLSKLQQAQNPLQATAAAIGYERPAGWSAQNPLGAQTFGKRLQSTVALAQNGFSTPFNGQPIGPNPSAFTPQQSAPSLPAMTASGQGMQLSPASPFARLLAQNAPGNNSGMASSSTGQPVPTDAGGNALDANGRPTSLAYAGSTLAPAQQAIGGATSGQPYGTVPLNVGGQMLTRQQAENMDGLDHTDYDAAAARAGLIRTPNAAPVFADGGSLQPASPATSTRAPGTSVTPPPAATPLTGVPTAPTAAAGVMPSQSRGVFQITPPMIQALLRDPDTQAFGIDLWKSLATSKKAPIVQDGYVIDGNTGQPLYALPQRPQQTDAIKNYTFAKDQGYTGSFTDYQADQQKADKAQLVDVPLPNGQFQKAWSLPGQIPTPANYVGTSYTRQPANQVTIDQKAESSQEGEYGKAVGQEIGETVKAGASAPQALNQIAMMRAAAARAGDNLSTGPFGPWTLKAKQAIGNALGIEIPGTSEGEVINNIGYGLATQAARAISNRPTQFEFGQALAVKPGLSLSPQGMQAVLNIREQDLHDQVALAKLANVKENRDNWAAVKADYYAQHPVMSPFDPSQPLGAGDVQAINDSVQGGGQPQSISTQDAASLPVISSPAAAARLKPGDRFKTPDGRVMQR